MDIYSYLAVSVVISILLVIFLVNLKMYYYHKIEGIRCGNKVSTFINFLFIPSKQGFESTIKYLFTFPKEDNNDTLITKALIKKHYLIVCLLASLIFIDLILLLF